ncbi:hypothetical protein AB9K26_04260 [Psychroserpens sp. XS_ASV72]|uniref:hypothetical protein n=1 Tax=Psychroserpens sp. XS_ASV72 TaxID=3241293 RepID=UPI003519770E
MIKKLMCLSMMLSLSWMVNSQTIGPITITHGQEIEADKEKIVRIAGEANGKIYTLASKKDNFYIKVFNSEDMSLISTNEIEMKDFKDKEPEFEEIAVIDGRIYILGSVYDKKEKVANLLAVEISEDGKLTDNAKKLFSTKVTKNRERGAFYIKESPNLDRLLILHAALFDKEEVIQYEIKLVNNNLDIMAEYLEKVPFNDRRDLEFDIADFDVNFNDDFFIVINESFRDKKTKTNHEKFQLHAFKAANGYQKEVTDIAFTDKEIINCEMLAGDDGRVRLVGFYSSVRKSGKANKELKGVYASVVDVNSNSVEQLKFNEFDYETKVKLIGERRAKKGKDVKPLYVTHSLVQKSDGGLILLSEYQQIVVGRSSGIGPLAFTPVTHINNEIIVTSINPDGTVGWSNVIPKKQKAAYTTMSIGFAAFSGNSNFTVSAGVSVPVAVLGKGPEYLSAMPVYENGKLTVIFNDNTKNYGVTDIEEIKWLGNYNKAVPTAMTFDDNGEITRLDQEDVQKQQLVLRPRVFFRKTDKEYIIYSSRKSQDKLGRMSVN